MFKTLHRKMLVSNLAILTLFMILIFTSLYISTYQDINKRIDIELTNINRAYGNPQNTPGQITLLPQGQTPNLSNNLSVVVVLEDGVVSDYVSGFNFQEGYIKTLVSSTDLNDDTVTLSDVIYRYSVTNEDNKTLISYVNITKDMALLHSQLQRYIIILALTVILSGLISHFLTKRNIKPIEESYKKQKEFVQNASHELKTPLTVINTNIDVILSNKNNTSDTKWLEYIKAEVKRMNKLSNDLLYLANEEDNNVMKTDFSASESLERLLLGVEALAYEHKITLDYHLEKDVFIHFNKEQFTQVVLILLDNAIKYSSEGEHITVSLEQNNKHKIVKVRNTGEGIKEDILERLFDRFYKVDQSRENKKNSYGLGLSIAKAIMENHKGHISVSSVLGEYTEFELKIK